MYKIGDIIQRENKNNYSYANIYSNNFTVIGITEKDYILKQPNYIGNMNIEVVNSIFIKAI